MWAAALCASIGALPSSTPAHAQAQDRGEEKPPAVLYTQARQAQVEDSFRAVGTVLPSRSAWIAAEISGAVERLEVRVGDRVKKGQALARLRSLPMKLRLAAAGGELKEAEARLASVQLRLERVKRLAGSEVVSSQTADDAAYEVQSWEGRVARLKAEAERLQDDLDRTVLRAPFAGAVVAEKTQVGQWINIGDPVVELVALRGLEARLDIPEDRYRDVEPGHNVTITSDAFPDRHVTGKLRAIVPQAADRARTFPAYVTLPDDAGLAVGILVRGECSLSSQTQAVLVPSDAVVRRESGHRVFVLDTTDGDSVRSIEVRLGGRQGLWREVYPSGKLSNGDSVITQGNENLRDGQRVSAQAEENVVR